MKREELINKIFNNTISNVLLNIDEKYIEEITIAYKDYLNRLYSNFDDKGLTDDKLEEVFTKLENSAWTISNQGTKLSILLKDEAFNSIKSISNAGYKYALQMLENKSNSNNKEVLPVISKEISDKNINMMTELLSNVREFNVELANNIVSEGIVDYKFASGQTKYMSLRIGRISK